MEIIVFYHDDEYDEWRFSYIKDSALLFRGTVSYQPSSKDVLYTAFGYGDSDKYKEVSKTYKFTDWEGTAINARSMMILAVQAAYPEVKDSIVVLNVG